MIAEAFQTVIDALDAQYHQARQDLEATGRALEAKYTQTRQGLLDANGLIQKLSGQPAPAAIVGVPPSPAALPTVPAAKAAPRKRVRNKKKVPPEARSAAPSTPASLPATTAPSAPLRSTRQTVLDAIVEWASTDKIAAATGFPAKKIRGVLNAKDLQAKIERRGGADGQRLEFRAKPQGENVSN